MLIKAYDMEKQLFSMNHCSPQCYELLAKAHNIKNRFLPFACNVKSFHIALSFAHVVFVTT